MKTLMRPGCGETEDPLKGAVGEEFPAEINSESQLEKLRAILDGLDGGAYVSDMETFEILYLNSYGRDIFGDVEGKICWQVLQENQSGPCPFCNNRQLVNEDGLPGKVLFREFENTRNHRWYECRDSAVYWFGGRVVRLEIAKDITERKQKEEKHTRNLKLETLCVLMERVIHDFNNLLSLSMGYLSLARLNVPPDDPVSGFLEKAEEAFMRSRELTARLFALTGEASPCLRMVALDTLLLDSVRSFLKSSDLKSSFVLADSLRPVSVDEDQIRQVIFHLLLNARQAMPEGGQVIIRADNVFLTTGEKGNTSDGSYVCWSVEDQGIGISQDDLPRIFDLGFTSWPGEKSNNSGWGLAVCHAIIKKHQGHIECHSKPGAGTTFSIYLPAVKVA